MPIAGHDLGAFDRHLADLFRRQRALTGLQVYDPGVGVRERQADRPDLPGAKQRVGVRDRRGLSQTVPLHQASAGQRFKSVGNLNR